LSEIGDVFVNVLTEIDDELDDLINDKLNSTEPDYISAMRLSTQVKLLIRSSSDKIESLTMIVQVGTGLLTKMVKVLPVNKTELLSNLAMDSGVSQINEISKDVSEITKLTRGISDSIYEKTHIAVLELIKLNSASAEEVQHLKDNAAKRLALTNEVNAAVKTMHENIKQDRIDVIEAVKQTDRIGAIGAIDTAKPAGRIGNTQTTNYSQYSA